MARCYRAVVSWQGCERAWAPENLDARVQRAIGKAVPRLRGSPDSGCGAQGRVLEYDAISFKRGLTRAEAQRVAKAARSVGQGVRARVAPGPCR